MDGARFGHDVAVAGGLIAVGAPGAGKVFTVPDRRMVGPMDWRHVSGRDGFGEDVALGRDRLWVGRHATDSERGVVDEYRARDDGNWSHLIEFRRSERRDGDRFGHGLALGVGIGIVGVEGYDTDDDDNIGGAVIFELAGPVCTSDGQCVCRAPERGSPCGDQERP